MSNEELQQNPYASPRDFEQAARQGEDVRGDSDEIETAGQFLPRDLKYGFRLCYGRRFVQGRLWFALTVIAAAIFLVLVDLSAVRINPTRQRDVLLLVFACCGISFYVICGIWGEHVRFRNPQQGCLRFNGEGIRSLSDDMDQLYRWSAFSLYRQDQYMIVFAAKLDFFVIAPRTCFAPADWERLALLASRKLTQK